MSTSSHSLCIDNHSSVYLACGKICAKWEDLAARLYVARHYVEIIRADGNDSADRLRKLLDVWLRRSSSEQRLPSWRGLCDALSHLDLSLSEEISRQHQCGCYLCTVGCDGGAPISLVYPLYNEIYQKLKNPVGVAEYMYSERAFSSSQLEEIQNSPGNEREILFTSLESAVSLDHYNLRVFGKALMEEVATHSLGVSIIAICKKEEFPSKSKIKKFFVEMEHKRRFQSMRVSLGRLCASTITLLSEKRVDVSNLKKQLELAFPELARDLAKCSSIDEVVTNVIRPRVSLVQIDYLEAVFDLFNLATKSIEEYNQKVEELCEPVKVVYGQLLMEEFDSSTTSELESIKFVLDWDENEHSLRDIQDLFKKIVRKYSSRVKVIVISEGNSIVVECCVPTHLLPVVTRMIQDSEKILNKEKVISVTAGGRTIFKRIVTVKQKAKFEDTPKKENNDEDIDKSSVSLSGLMSESGTRKRVARDETGFDSKKQKTSESSEPKLNLQSEEIEGQILKDEKMEVDCSEAIEEEINQYSEKMLQSTTATLEVLQAMDENIERLKKSFEESKHLVKTKIMDLESIKEFVKKLQSEYSLLPATLTERENEDAILKRELEKPRKDQSTEGMLKIKPDWDEQTEATSSGYISMKQGLEEQTMTSCTDEDHQLIELQDDVTLKEAIDIYESEMRKQITRRTLIETELCTEKEMKMKTLMELDLLKELQRISYKSKKETEQENVILKKEVKRLQKEVGHRVSAMLMEDVIKDMRMKMKQLHKITHNKLSKEEQQTLNENLLTAVSKGKKDEVITLIASGAEIDCSSINKDQKTPLHHASNSKLERSDLVKELLQSGANPNCVDKLKKTPLHFGSERGHAGVVESLAAYGATIDSQNSDRKTPLHLAAAGGHNDVVQILLDLGANCDMLDRVQRTPLHYASDRGHVNVVRNLLSYGAEVNSKDRNKSAAIHLASAGGHTEILQALLDNDAEYESANDWHSPLTWTVLGGHTEAAKCIVAHAKKHGAKIFGKNESDYWPIRIATELDNEDAIEYFISSGAISKDEVELEKQKYQLPHDWIASRNGVEIQYTNLKSGRLTKIHPNLLVTEQN